jgi:3-hydroxybutyryl-CoA dehydrogenase
MKKVENHQQPILLSGSNKLAYSIALCLLRAGQKVTLLTSDEGSASQYFTRHTTASPTKYDPENLEITTHLRAASDFSMAIALTGEDLSEKQQVTAELEAILSEETLIAINTEVIPLSELQKNTVAPERILGANWVEPADTTYFLEIIANGITLRSYTDYLSKTAAENWNKDPYVIHGDSGIRMRLFTAMLREAFYLVGNGYANIGDIDRACRNDAGYYLPFAGNLRYMDLMGTHAYGMVMKDLNPELARDIAAPDFFTEMIQNKQLGMESGSGFYSYGSGESKKWELLMEKFSQEINGLFQKYPFNDRAPF